MIKSKRLKNFCQVCRKQCKDQNGYHCHLNSAHHQKRLRELATNPQQHIEKYSNQLQNRIVQILKNKYPGEAKDIEQIYQQYAQDKHHVKFNFTRWKDISQFVDHLRNNVRNLKVTGKIPYCTVTYVVSKSTDFIRKKKQQQIQFRRQKEKQINEKKLQERISKMRQMEVERYKQSLQKNNHEDDEQEEIDIQNEEIRIDFNDKVYQPSKLFNLQLQKQKQTQKQKQSQKKTNKSNIQKLLQQLQKNPKKSTDEGMKAGNQQSQFQWIMPGIMVKIKPHQIPQVFHHKKSPILSVKEPYVAEVKVGNASLEIDQTYLETVIPKVGNQVCLLKGQHRGRKGLLKGVDIAAGVGLVEIGASQQQANISKASVVQVPFNQFSKVS